MNDQEVDNYITRRLEEMDICLQDMIGGRYIDPDPENRHEHWKYRSRWNRFKSLSGEMRMMELLTEGEFDPDLPYNNIGLPVKDLVRYWWNNIADHDAVLDMVLEDIFVYHKDRMLRHEPVEKPVDISDALDEVIEAVG